MRWMRRGQRPSVGVCVGVPRRGGCVQLTADLLIKGDAPLVVHTPTGRDQLAGFLEALIEHGPTFEYVIDMHYLDGLQDPRCREDFRDLSSNFYGVHFC